VTGDRCLIRFLRAKKHNVSLAANQYSSYLDWRVLRNVDWIRHSIATKLNSPLLFPKGEAIIKYTKMIVMSPHATDKFGRPLLMESYDFSPSEMFKEVSLDDYMLFFLYCMEYRSMILEQLSEKKEREYINLHPSNRDDGYGVVLMNFSIRDLTGVTKHIL
jgi:hypothetical protein